LRIGLFVVGLAGYLILFYTAPLPSLPANLTTGEPFRRLDLQVLLLQSPSYYFDTWVGGDVSRVGVLDRVPILLLSALIIGIAYLIGRTLLELIHADAGLSRLETFVFGTGVGLNVLSLFTLIMGLLGALHRPILFVLPLAVACCWAGWRWTRRWFEPLSDPASQREGARHDDVDWLGRSGLWLAVPFIVVILLGGMLPPWEFDVREYHLQVPKEWYQQGRIGFLPHNVYGNMPLGAEMHALLAMVLIPGQSSWWWGALTGKTIIALFAPLTALTLFAAGRRLFSTTAGVVASLAYISIPWIANVSVNGLVEGAVTFYLLLAVYVVLIWSFESPASLRTDSPERGGGEVIQHIAADATARGRLMLTGFFAGSAVACKYPAVLFVLLPLAVWVLSCRRPTTRTPAEGDPHTGPRADATGGDIGLPQRIILACRWVVRSPNWPALIVYLLAAACGCGLWFGKNWVLSGNPTYPLLFELFDGKTRTPEKNAQWEQAHRVPLDAHGNRYSLRQLSDAVTNVTWRSEWLSPLLIPLALLAPLVPAHRRPVWILAGMLMAVMAAWWLFTHRIDRFWIPALPLVALLAGVGATWTTARLWRHLLIAILFWGLVSNFLVVASRTLGDNRYFVALEDLRRDEPREADGRFSRINPAHRYLNSAVRDGFRVLLVGDAQPFDLEMPALYNTCFDDCIFEQLMNGRSRDERLAVLRKYRISHVFVHWAEIRRYRSPGNYGFTDYVTKELVHDELVQKQKLLSPVKLGFSRDFGEVFEVLGVAALPQD
jgi:hypothetical protein